MEQTVVEVKECQKNPVNGRHCWSACTAEAFTVDPKLEPIYYYRRYCIYCGEEIIS